MLNPIDLNKIGKGKLLCWNQLAMFHNIVDEITCGKIIMIYPCINLLNTSFQKQLFFKNTLFKDDSPFWHPLKTTLFSKHPI